jgi:hypothetical protein
MMDPDRPGYFFVLLGKFYYRVIAFISRLPE